MCVYIYIYIPGTPSVQFFWGNFTSKTSNYCLKNRTLGVPGISFFVFNVDVPLTIRVATRKLSFLAGNLCKLLLANVSTERGSIAVPT